MLNNDISTFWYIENSILNTSEAVQKPFYFVLEENNSNFSKDRHKKKSEIKFNSEN